MSFELHLLAPAGAQVRLPEVREYLARQPPVEMPTAWGAHEAAWYRNPDTGVVFWIENDFGNHAPERFRAVVSCYLNYARPSFFALEAMPFISNMARRFDLVAEVGQAAGMPAPIDEVQLVEAWRSGNRVTIEAAAREGTLLPYMPEGLATSMWRYNYRLDELRARFGLDVFVPKLKAAREAGGDLVRHMTWTEAVPLVLPECDLASLVAEPIQSRFKLRGVIDCQELRSGLAALLEELAGDPDGLCLLPPLRVPDAIPIFRAMKPRRRTLSMVANDDFVDWRPGG